MSNTFYSANRGTGLKPVDITTGASSTSGDDVELRVADGASLTKKDVDLIVERIMVFFKSRLNTTAPPL